MSIKRYKADSDTTIVNAYQPDMVTRGTGANMGLADVLETFSIYGRQASGSSELSRILIKFPISDITTDRTNSVIPASGSVSFYLRMFNAKTSKTVPVEYKLIVSAISQSWQEGIGLDLEQYKDITKGNTGANWMSASNTTAWPRPGGNFLTGASDIVLSQSFPTGLEDLEIDVSDLVEKWIAGTLGDYGMGVFLSSAYEAYTGSGAPQGSNLGGATVSYYTKRFFARGTQYFFKRPVIEARWDDSRRDNRGDFYYSSSLAPAADNLNTIYLYNYVRGRLRDIPRIGTGSILVSLYSGSSDNSVPSGSKLSLHDATSYVTGGWVSTGIYSASIAITAAATPLETLYDVWYSGSVQYSTGAIAPKTLRGGIAVAAPTHYLNITNLKDKYRHNEVARFNLFIRNKYWDPTVYTVANTAVPTKTIQSASYTVYRVLDSYNAIPYGTGADLHTVLSYDVSGNYFDCDMSLLQPGYAYAFKFSFYDPELQSWVEQSETFKFRVEDYEY
ncbi:hypothetical protein CMI47_17060 [Candidatus Pacearchaeota archaeon]|nr:hypothetical protein [Candidatus Pacearchaeota archaeon]|tara:strand:- start:670 stop:2178 length:1509 start_codon:yes stop_codon:yes gene_type:complete